MTVRPRLERPPVRIPRLAGPLAAVWEGICALANTIRDAPWTVVGGQMVFLHAAEHGVPVHRLSADIDAAVDVRADPGAMRKVVTALVELGFTAAGASPDGTACRFEKRGGSGSATVGVVTDDVLAIDLLAPEGLGPRADLTTVGSATAFVAPGVSQALTRTELVPVAFVADQHWVPRPNLLGAIVAKAAASAVDRRDRERHQAGLPVRPGCRSLRARRRRRPQGPATAADGGRRPAGLPSGVASRARAVRCVGRPRDPRPLTGREAQLRNRRRPSRLATSWCISSTTCE